MSDLTDLIRAVTAKMPGAQPEEIAAAVAKRTPKAKLLARYTEALRPMVVDILRLDRNIALNAALGEEPVPESTAKHSKPAEPTPRRKPTPSRKTARARSWWQSMKDADVFTERGHVRLGSCGRDDLKYLIADRQRHVTDVYGQIANYERLLELLDVHEVETVDELPEQERVA